MSKLLERLHEIRVIAWVRFVQILNWLALSIGGVVTVIDAAYHNEISNALGGLPVPVRLIAYGSWALLVHYALRRAAKAV